jgi:hypothetical protein
VRNQLLMVCRICWWRTTHDVKILRLWLYLDVAYNLVGKVSTYALNKIYEEYQKTFDVDPATFPPCTQTLKTTMGLPCMHQIHDVLVADGHLTMNDVHQQWWLNVQSDHLILHTNSAASFEETLTRLRQSFGIWPEHQRTMVIESLLEIADTPSLAVLDPVTSRTRGRPSGSHNRADDNSTRRDPSGFEYTLGNLRKCGKCRQPGHNSRRCSTNLIIPQ